MPDPICAALAAVEASNQFGRFARHNFGAPVQAGNSTGVVGKTIIPQRLHPSSQTTVQNRLQRLSGIIDTATKMPTPESNSVQTVALASLASGTSFPVWSRVWEERNKRDKDYYAQLDLAL